MSGRPATIDGQRLEMLLLQRHMSKKRLAELVRVRPTTITHICSSGHTSRATLQRILEVLDITATALQAPTDEDRIERTLLDLFRPLTTVQKIRVVAMVHDWIERGCTSV